jgi:CHASE2 domain-containing sensor protein
VRLIRHLENRSALLPAILCACAVAFLLFWGRMGEGISFDALVLFGSGPTPTEAVIVTMDEMAYGDKKLNEGYEYPKFNRATHGKLLDKLKEDGAKLVVFDLFFKEPQPEDPKLAAAITNNGKVVIVCEIAPFGPRFPGFATNDPVKPFDNLAGCTIALPLGHQDVTRMFQPDTEYRPSLARAAAEKWGASADALKKAERWVKYYGNRDKLPMETYRHAMDHSSNYFAGKAVFIGGRPNIPLVSEPSDEFGTSWTRWTGNKMRGVEVQATMFLNLIHNDWLTRMSTWHEIILILLVGIIFGAVFTLFRPVPGLILVPIGVALVSIGAMALLWKERIWFNWLVIGWIEIPLAWATSAVIYSRVLFREKESLKHERDSLKKEILTLISAHATPGTLVPQRPGVSAAEMLAKVQPITIKDEAVAIEQYKMLKKIGEGAFGQVWLATDRVENYCAIKVVFRKNFADQRPFEREFEGVRNFAAVSRRHPGWVPILHIGINESAGFFYYVMEPADDLETGQKI